MRSLARSCCAALALAALFLLLSAANRVAAQAATDANPALPGASVSYKTGGPKMATLPEPVGTVEPQTYTLAFQGVETAPGTPDYNMDTLVGINYAGEASGPLTGALSFSFSQKSLVFDASGGNDLNGNTWSLVVFKDGECQGVVFGEITGGRATWSKDGSGRLDGALVVKGGSGAFVDAAKIQAAGWFKLLRVKDASGQQIISGTVEMSF